MAMRRCADRGEMQPYSKSARKIVTKSHTSLNGVATRPTSGPDSASVQMDVFVRVRPFNEKESNTGCKKVVCVESDKTMVFDPVENSEPFFFRGALQKTRDINRKPNKNMIFEFNRVFDENCSNELVFNETTRGIVKSVVEGYNCSVFAYGATGAGKTFTMLGSPDNPGIAYRTIVELLNQVEALDGWQVTLGASYIEVYNENVRDLLHPNTGMLQLREEERGRVMVANLKVERIQSSNQLFALLAEGNRNRSQHPTDSNAESSRSHAVFQVHVHMEQKGEVKISKLSMIDLAGSERGAATNYKGTRFKEGSNINKSLLALGNCINALADGLRHVPYRDSKLTRILKDSLGGNCRTMMIANVAPSSLTFEDTYNTLKYATRAKSIKSQISRNLMSETMSIAQYKKLVQDLKHQLTNATKVNTISFECFQTWEQKIAQVMDEKKRLHKEMLTLQSEKKITEWRLNHKTIGQNEKNSIDELIINRTQTGINQLKGRLDTFQNCLDANNPILASIHEREENLEKEIRADELSPILLHVLNEYRLEIMKEEHLICLKHQLKISQLQSKELQNKMAACHSVTSVMNEYYSLLSALGHLTKDLDIKHQDAVKQSMEGMKAVQFEDFDNLEPTEVQKLLRLSLHTVREKPLVTPEEMDDYRKKMLPLKERSLNTNDTTFPILKKEPFNPLPLFKSKTFIKSVPFNNKENGYSPKTKIVGTPAKAMKGLKAVRNHMSLSRVHPYGGSGTPAKKMGPVSKAPIKMNKIAAARMLAAIR